MQEEDVSRDTEEQLIKRKEENEKKKNPFEFRCLSPVHLDLVLYSLLEPLSAT